MSDLPSRDVVDEALPFAPLTDIADDPIFDIARAYVSGRLVDRETIDYEAAQRMLDIIDQLVPPLRTADDARPIVDAAIGGSDEK